jgi:hypothetical protein
MSLYSELAALAGRGAVLLLLLLLRRDTAAAGKAAGVALCICSKWYVTDLLLGEDKVRTTARADCNGL